MAELGLRISFSPILSFLLSVVDLRLKGEWEIRRYDHPCRTSCFGESKQNCEFREENFVSVTLGRFGATCVGTK